MKTIVYIATSLDGFIARKNGDIDWLINYESKEVYDSFKEFIKGIDAIVIGRRTYEKVLSFPNWPYHKEVFVLSTTVKNIPDNLKDKVIIISVSPNEILSHLSKNGYSNIYIDGGKTIQNFLKKDLVNEMIITIIPILIGDGISLFGELKIDMNFKHIKTITYANGLVKNHYKRKYN